ncbi:MAG: hypothetical protein GY703_07020 [Gammaproteobacteria bacterium]|nr:hypothetical protein [Gammaproteobacteria bacterium]
MNIISTLGLTKRLSITVATGLMILTTTLLGGGQYLTKLQGEEFQSTM